MRFGAHVSIANHLYDAVNRAVAFGCEAMQIFPGNPRGWQTGYLKLEEIDKFNERRQSAGIYPLAIHLPYLVNLGSPIDRVFEASIKTVLDSLEKAKLLNADFLVVHTGSHVGAGRAFGLRRIRDALKVLLKNDFGQVKLLLENTSGSGYTLGAKLEDIAQILSSVDLNPILGLCLDTCHAYAAGYDLADKKKLDDFLKEIDNSIGLNKLGLVHANDCRGILGGHVDRHEHIGKGSIGAQGFKNILTHPALGDMTFIIETPHHQADDDIDNLETLRRLS